MGRSYITFFAFLFAACGGGDDAKSVGGAPTCGAGELIIEGTYDGEPVSETRSGYNTVPPFENAVGTDPGTLRIGFPNLENVYFEFSGFAKDNTIVTAKSFVDFDAGGGIAGGYCDAMDNNARLLVPKAGKQFEFEITGLRDGEPECTATLVPAALKGCFLPRVQVDAGTGS